VPSLLRNFSAPVKLDYAWSRDQLMFLMSHDPDGFNRWDAGQKLAIDVIQSMLEGNDTEVDERLIEAYRNLLADTDLDRALVARMLALPGTAYLIELTRDADVQAIHETRQRVQTTVAKALREELLAVYMRNQPSEPYAFSAEQVAARSLGNSALSLLTVIGDEAGRDLAVEQFRDAHNMTNRFGALSALVNSPFDKERDRALGSSTRTGSTIRRWLNSGLPYRVAAPGWGLKRVRELLEHPAFDWKNPNKIRTVIGVLRPGTWSISMSRTAVVIVFWVNRSSAWMPAIPRSPQAWPNR